MTETEKQNEVSFGPLKMEISVKANNEGPLTDMESWKKAFPQINFLEVDEMNSGEKIDWERRSVDERIFYVAFMENPERMRVDYELMFVDVCMVIKIDEAEKIWKMWMDGCFSRGDELGEKEIKFDEKAIKTFLWYACNSEVTRGYIGDVDLQNVEVVKVEAGIAHLDTKRSHC